MYLALNEIKKNKIRYGLVISVISLITFLIFILTSLALGLANENTTALKTWKIKSAIITKDSNGNIGQSLMSAEQFKKIKMNSGDSQVGITPTNLKMGRDETKSVQYVGVKKDQEVYNKLEYITGRPVKAENEVVVSDKIRNIKVNDEVKLGQSDQSYKVVGIVNNAEYNMAPVVYGALNQWHKIKGVDAHFVGSGVLSINHKNKNEIDSQDLTLLTIDEFMNKLPGYSAQNATFTFMIAFLVLISLVVVTIFLYILTTQKIKNLAVLRAQGIPNAYLLKNTFNETAIIMISSILMGLVTTFVISLVIPESVPMYFDVKFTLLIAGGTLITGLLGALIPMRIISKIDPVSVIGG